MSNFNTSAQTIGEDYSSTASTLNSERIVRSGILKSYSPFDDSDLDELDHRILHSRSPPPKCAICLSKCHNKCFTDSCLHQFCFQCLLEWSKVSFSHLHMH